MESKIVEDGVFWIVRNGDRYLAERGGGDECRYASSTNDWRSARRFQDAHRAVEWAEENYGSSNELKVQQIRYHLTFEFIEPT